MLKSYGYVRLGTEVPSLKVANIDYNIIEIIKQKTENTIDSYMLHDYFLFQFLRNRYNLSKIIMHIKNTLKCIYNKDKIRKYLCIFIKKFLNNHLKRNCMTDRLKTGSVCLSSMKHSKLRSDADADIRLKDIDNS